MCLVEVVILVYKEIPMEELLNKLIEKGWKPFGYELLYPDVIEDCFDYDSRNKKCRFLIHKNFVDEVHNSLREVVSRESGLWQFVCENGLENRKEWKQRTDLDEDGREYVKYSTKFVEYRLIESALKDESELEEFLLSNIKIGK